ncbi:unnamed protein product [Caenorhabditis brenneri]
MLRKTTLSVFTLNKFLWDGPGSRPLDVNVSTASAFKLLENKVTVHNKLLIDFKAKDERLGVLLQDIILKINTEVWEREVMKKIEEIRVVHHEIVAGERESLNALNNVWSCFVELRAIIERIKQQKFQTSYTSYQGKLDQLYARMITSFPKATLELKIQLKNIELAQIRVDMFNVWKSIETKKLIIQDLKKFKEQVRNNMIWTQVIRQPCWRILQTPLSFNNIIKIGNIVSKYSGVPMTTNFNV